MLNEENKNADNRMNEYRKIGTMNNDRRRKNGTKNKNIGEKKRTNPIFAEK